ncbi:MAG: SGNH/GDSL hydrolase family protein [Verrucomicrobiales bacterium]|nr:SGNH/GDSL hydrolase family protein [Verrucomicrobiales bacterium]
MKNEQTGSVDGFSRRGALKAALVAGGAAVVGAGSAFGQSAGGGLKKGGVVLFQGDSITDAGRDKKRQSANNSGGLGRGYPNLIAGYLLATQPALGLQIHNRGISGNKVPDLDRRWDKDCLELKPDVLSILVGVNDIWHKLNGNYDGTVATYETGFAALLERTKKALPDTRIVVCEPFVLRCGAVNEKWFPEFDERIAAAKRVAGGAGAAWVPFQAMFDEAVEAGTEPKYWAGDGVHPTLAGHALMAREWLKVVAG